MRFGSTLALNSLDIEIKSGITGLVGANGAGKSTLLKLVLGLLEPTTGSLKTLGHDPLENGTEVRSRIGYFPERNVLPDTMPAHEFVRIMTQLRGLPRSQARGRASDALWSVGLGEERFRTLGTMSTGQRQRVKLAQALAADPALVLLDEPTEGLDPVQRDAMLSLISEVRDRHSVDIVMSSHVLNEIEQVCTEIIALDNGEVTIAGPIGELLGTGATNAASSLAQVSIELVEDETGIATVQQALQQAGCTVDVSGALLHVTAPNDASTNNTGTNDDSYDLLCDLCRDAVADAGARLRVLGTHKHRLEEVILAAADERAHKSVTSETGHNR